ncbi:hypothetical protein HYU07_04835 [Candidatus Woesearchaeota archaeon]|nr:hypothetical protein [Candidatus Woesearchaeota archaeon]
MATALEQIKEIISKEFKKLREAFRKSEKNSYKYVIGGVIFGVLTSLFFYTLSVQDSIKNTEKTLNYTTWITSPVTLKVVDWVNESEGRWYINVTNTHPLRSTGTIYLYRFEINPHTPHIINKTGIGPGQTIFYSLAFNVTEKDLFPNRSSLEPLHILTISNKAYYVMEHESISFKISCDNCPSQGIIRRFPDFEIVKYRMSFTTLGLTNLTIPSYTWVDYTMKDLIEEYREKNMLP